MNEWCGDDGVAKMQIHNTLQISQTSTKSVPDQQPDRQPDRQPDQPKTGSQTSSPTKLP